MEYQIQDKSLIKKFMDNKVNRLENTILMISNLIQDRLDVKVDSLKQVDELITNTRNEIFRLDNLSGYNTFNLDNTVHVLGKKIDDMEILKVREQVDAWRDIVVLKEKLIALFGELDGAKDKINLVESIKEK